MKTNEKGEYLIVNRAAFESVRMWIEAALKSENEVTRLRALAMARRHCDDTMGEGQEIRADIGVCKKCGKPFVQASKGQQYCGTWCRLRYQPAPQTEKICARCGETFRGDGRRRYCSPECAGFTTKKKGRAPRVCIVCGETFVPTNNKQISCSAACANERHKQVMREYQEKLRKGEKG